jgi:protein-tyrosine phosphatase
MSSSPPIFPRVVALQGATNFRDLGGYTGAQGHLVRWGRLFRSEHLANLTPQDVQHLDTLGIQRAFDFRGEQESALQAYDWPPIQRHPLPIEPTVVQRLQAQSLSDTTLTADDAVQAMQDTYRDFVRQNSPRFAELFDHLLNDDSPLVFHCTAGKDRTGLAAVLILFALGVSMATIQDDYLLTNQHYKRAVKHTAASPTLPHEVLNVVWQVQPAFLEAALATIQDDHGGLAPYISQKMGLTPSALNQLRARYLVAPVP